MLILFAITKTSFSWNFYLLSNTFLSMSLLPSKISKAACLFQILTLILPTWRIWWAPNNASKWQMGFNSAFKGLMWYCSLTFTAFSFLRSNQKYNITPVPSNTTHDILTLPNYTVKNANKILLCEENSPSLTIADSLPPLSHLTCTAIKSNPYFFNSLTLTHRQLWHSTYQTLYLFSIAYVINCVTFCNMSNFYGDKLSEIFPTPKMENHPLLAACDCLLNKFTITFNLWTSPPPSPTWKFAMPWWLEPTKHRS